MELTGTQGKFDSIKIDSANNRLLACHTGNGSLDVIDVITSELIKSIPTGNAQGVAIDSENNRYFVSVSKPPKMVIVDSTKLDVMGEVALPGPADLVALVHTALPSILKRTRFGLPLPKMTNLTSKHSRQNSGIRKRPTDDHPDR